MDELVALPKEKIDDIFELADGQLYYFLALYQAVYPHRKDIDKIDGFPKVGPKTYKYLLEKAIAFDKNNVHGVIPGKMWMNRGFRLDESIEDWYVTHPLRKETEAS